MKSAVRRAIAAGACLGLLTAGGQLTLQAQAEASVSAGAPTELSVVAADPPSSYTSDQVYVAGETGFLHRYGTTTSPILWTRYADGVTTAIPELATVSPTALMPAGGDVVTTVATVPSHSASGQVTVLDLATMAWQQLPRPVSSDATYLGYYGDAMVVQTGTAKLGLRRFAADGTFTTTPVTGIPADATSVASTKVGDATAVVLHLVTGGEFHYALLDLTTAVVTLLPVQPISSTLVFRVLLTADRVGFFGGPTGGRVVRSYPRNALTADPLVVSLPDINTSSSVALAGTHVIASIAGSSPAPVVDYSAAGETVLPLGQPNQGLVQGSDGVLLVGGTGPADWAVRRITADRKVATLQPLDGPLTNAGLSISQGLVRHVEAEQLAGDPTTRYLLFNHALSAGTDGIQPQTDGGTLTDAQPCDAAVACTRTVDGNGYGTTYLTAGTTANTSVLRTQVDGNTSTISVTIPSAPGRIVDASLDYVVVNGSDPAQQYVIKPGYGDVQVVGPIGAAALWFDTLWTSPKTGYLTAKNLASGKSAAAVPTGAPCVAAELQATGRYVYWSCGANGPAGVYDQTRKVSTTVPAGQSLLGDGYLVQHESDSGDLVRYDLATGTAATVATIPRGALADDRGITWAVDRFGGDIAYVDAANAVHVVDSGVAPTAPAVGIRWASSDGRVDFGQYGAWSVNYALSRPVAAWTLTVTQVSTGKVVGTRTGGPNRVTLLEHSPK